MVTIYSGWTTSLPDFLYAPCAKPSKSMAMAIFLLKLAHRSGENLFALVNAARQPELLGLLARQEDEALSLYENTRFSRLFEVAPFLIKLRHNTRLLQWLVSDAWGSNSTSWLISPATLPDLATSLRRFTTVRDELEIEVLFRFQDPTILFTFLQFSSPDVVALFMDNLGKIVMESTGDSLCLFDRFEYFNEVFPTSHLEPLREIELPLQMTTAHTDAFHALMMSRFIERAMLHVRIKHPMQTAQLSDEMLRQLLTRAVPRARELGIVSRGQVFNFLRCVVELGDAFDEDPRTAWAGELIRNTDLSIDDRLWKILTEIGKRRRQ